MRLLAGASPVAGVSGIVGPRSSQWVTAGECSRTCLRTELANQQLSRDGGTGSSAYAALKRDSVRAGDSCREQIRRILPPQPLSLRLINLPRILHISDLATAHPEPLPWFTGVPPQCRSQWTTSSTRTSSKPKRPWPRPWWRNDAPTERVNEIGKTNRRPLAREPGAPLS